MTKTIARQATPDEALADRTETLAAAAQLTAQLYRSPLDAKTARRLAEMDVTDAGNDPVLSEPACQEGMERMAAWCAQADETALRKASDDFHDLFVGPHALKAAPWSSVYLDSGKTLFGPTALKVRREFAAQGFATPEGNAEPADHVAYEWQFLADLHKRLAKELADDRSADDTAKAASGFFEQYLLPWTNEFCTAVEAGCRTGFYAGLASFTRGLARAEGALLSEVSRRTCGNNDRRP